MRLLRLDDLMTRPIEHHGGRNATVTLLAHGDAQVVRIELSPGGTLGRIRRRSPSSSSS